MDTDKTIPVALKDVYQFLVESCRYGYTRNNHLMPGAAYDKAIELLPVVRDADGWYATYIAKQLCEECITDQICRNFWDGEDDEHGSRKEAISFVRWCIGFVHEDASFQNWLPYCYDLFEENVKKDDEPRYNVYSVVDGERTLISEKPLSKNDYISFMVRSMDENAEKALYYRREIGGHSVSEDGKPTFVPYSYELHFTEPKVADFYAEHI